MNSSIPQRLNSNHGWVTIAVTAISLIVHGGLVLSAGVVIGGTHGRDLTRDVVAFANVEITFSCYSDANLSLSARSLACTLPGVRSPGCSSKALEDYKFDMLVCDGLQDEQDAEAVAFMSASEIEDLEPMPMLDIPEIDEFEAAKLLEEEIKQKEEEAEKRISNPRPSGQVVEVMKPRTEVIPEKSRFLSEYDVQVEEQTVARGSKEEMVAAPAPKELPIDAEPEELPEDVQPPGSEEEVVATNADGHGEGAAAATSESPLLAMRAMEFREEMTVGQDDGVNALEANGFTAVKGSGSFDQTSRQHQEGKETAGGASGASRVPSLRPSEETLSRVVGGGSVDRLDGVKSGEFTALNSKKWKFASFFNRMKRQVAQNWHPDVVYIRRDPTGKVYGTKDRVTVLEVSLKPNGSLAKVIVSQQSGVGFLDDEAVQAFHMAQPFPNPPTALVDSGSRLITFSFGFQFQVGSRRDAWQLFKFN